MSDSPSWLDVEENPGVVFLLAIVALSVVVVIAGLVVVGNQGDGEPEGINVVMGVSDAPAQYQGADYLPTDVIRITHRAGDEFGGNEVEITVVNESSGETVARWVGGEFQGGSAEEVSLKLKRGRSAGEEEETFATATRIGDRTVTPADEIVVVDEGPTEDFSKLTTYRVIVVDRDTGEALLDETTGIE